MSRSAHASGSRLGQPYTVSDGDDDDDDDELDSDPVLKTMPIYFTPCYNSSLTLLQYPDRPQRPLTHHPLLATSLTPDEDTPQTARITARFKQNSRHLEFQVPMEAHPDRWNAEAGKKYGEALPEEEVVVKKKKGGKKVEEPAADKVDKPLDRMVFSSLEVPDVTNYAAVVVKNGELHVNPVTLTFQLRPYLNYLDHAVTLERRKKREEAKNPDESDGEMSDTELKKLETKAVQVSVKQSADLSGGGAFGKSGGSGGGNGRASSSLFDPLRAMEGEQWRHMQHTPVDSEESQEMRENLHTSHEGKRITMISTTLPSAYLKS